MEGPVIAALVTGAASLIVGVITFFSSRANQRDVEHLKAELDEGKSERNARRDYEYEARKRLYHEYEPLFFQMTESAESALIHIQSLAERGREGKLGPDGYLSKNRYYLKATIYRLLVPVAIFKLINSRLTLVDLQVDSRIYCQYYLAKLLYLTYTQDVIFARIKPPLDYNPYQPGWVELRKENPSAYYRQGFTGGRIDNTLDALITRDRDASAIVSFGRFEGLLEGVQEDDFNGPLGVARDMFLAFHPKNRPVLWRILICQAQIYRCILRIRFESRYEVKELPRLINSLFSREEERRKYDWRQSEGEAGRTEVLEEPFDVAKVFLRQKFSESFLTPGA